MSNEINNNLDNNIYNWCIFGTHGGYRYSSGELMREIRYRVWDTKENRFAKWTDSKELLLDSYGNVLEYYDDGSCSDPDCCGNPEWYLIDTEKGRHEVTFYTGLTDKSGKDIFEGDVVKQDNRLYVVKYFPPRFFLWGIKAGQPNSNLYGTADKEPISLDVEVVGNQFENKDLLNA